MAEKSKESKPVLEREYTVPLRQGWLKVPKYKRTNKAVKTLKEFLARHMKVYDRDLRKIKVDILVNNEIRFKGMEKPPAKIKVKVKKDSHELVSMEFLDEDFYEFDFENKGHRIYHSFDFDTFEVSLDFSDKEQMESVLDKLRDQVEENCPVGALLNPSTDNNIGEGIVFKCVSEGYTDQSFMFKYKGEKHQRGGKSKVPTRLPQLTDEQQVLVDAFFQEALKEDRLLQGIEYLEEMFGTYETKHIGEYIKWISHDIIKEMEIELNELALLDITWRRLSGTVTKTAREYLMSKL